MPKGNSTRRKSPSPKNAPPVVFGFKDFVTAETFPKSRSSSAATWRKSSSTTSMWKSSSSSTRQAFRATEPALTLLPLLSLWLGSAFFEINAMEAKIHNLVRLWICMVEVRGHCWKPCTSHTENNNCVGLIFCPY